jgi:hypothetical protein
MSTLGGSEKVAMFVPSFLIIPLSRSSFFVKVFPFFCSPLVFHQTGTISVLSLSLTQYAMYSNSILAPV